MKFIEITSRGISKRHWYADFVGILFEVISEDEDRYIVRYRNGLKLTGAVLRDHSSVYKGL